MSESAGRLTSLIMLMAVTGCGFQNFPLATSSSCTMEAKKCPDGTYVTRTGADCQFRACPPPGQ